MPANNTAQTTFNSDKTSLISTDRITAIWALSEATLGGVLHAFKIPLTGLIINGSAVIFIALIAYYAKQNGAILKATFIVLLVKAGVSPHTPINSFLAVTIQGFLGELIFYRKYFFKFSAVCFGLLTVFLSSIQKIVVLTLVFGNNLWDSIDIFGTYVLNQLPFFDNSNETIQISAWLINLYIGTHLFAGLIVGFISGRIPEWLKNVPENSIINYEKIDVFQQLQTKKRKRKLWIKKPSGIIIMVIVSTLVVLSYVYPQFSTDVGLNAVIMVIRSVFIVTMWYLLAGPFVLKIYRKFLHKKGNKYTSEVNKVISILPKLKYVVYYCWDYSKKYKKLRRVKIFFVYTLINIIKLPLTEDE